MSIPARSSALLVALLLATVRAEEEALRRLVRTGEDGASTTLTAAREGGGWRVELVREHPPAPGRPAVEERLVVVLDAGTGADDALDALFRAPPGDPREWRSRVEALAGLEDRRDEPERLRSLPCGPDAWSVVPPSSDRVQLVSGEIVAGEVLALDPAAACVRTGWGVLQLPRDQVRRIDFRRLPRAVLGVTLVEDGAAARVARVLEGTAAARAGLRPGDVITAFAGEQVVGARHLCRLVSVARVGETVALSVRRGDAVLEPCVKLGAPPPTAGARRDPGAW